MVLTLVDPAPTPQPMRLNHLLASRRMEQWPRLMVASSGETEIEGIRS
jgi:hypothetical protein